MCILTQRFLFCCLFPNKCGRSEEEAELLHGLQLLTQLLIRIHGEARRRNGHPAAALDLFPQIIAHRVCDVIEYLHVHPPNLLPACTDVIRRETTPPKSSNREAIVSPRIVPSMAYPLEATLSAFIITYFQSCKRTRLCFVCVNCKNIKLPANLLCSGIVLLR